MLEVGLCTCGEYLLLRPLGGIAIRRVCWLVRLFNRHNVRSFFLSLISVAWERQRDQRRSGDEAGARATC